MKDTLVTATRYGPRNNGEKMHIPAVNSIIPSIPKIGL